jgi:hypothetical protein
MNKPTVAVLVLSSMFACSHAIAQSSPAVAPDNTKSNKVDASNSQTADAQSNNAMDLDLTVSVWPRPMDERQARV